MALRYYLYVSDAKVDMLLPQIDPGFARKHTVEAGLKLPLLSVKRNEEAQAPDRIARLERVARYLDDFCDVGSVDDPGQYFRGRMIMRWGQLPHSPSFVYFTGSTEYTIVGLGGSSGHVIGTSAPDAEEWGISRSSLYRIVRALTTAVERSGEDVPSGVNGAIQSSYRLMSGVEQDVEFVAKRLFHGPKDDYDSNGMVLLGTPLFVSLAD